MYGRPCYYGRYQAMDNQVNTQALLQQYLDGKCTPAGARALYEQLQATGSHKALLAVMQQEFERIMAEEHQVPEALSNRMETRLLQEINKTKATPVAVLFRRRWAVAATIAVLVTTAAVFFYIARKAATPPLAAQQTAADRAPGTYKAVLTLADGAVVTLDSAGKQVIRQGSVNVQQQNGQLQYAVNSPEDAAGYNVLTVPRGGQFNVVLPDGSQVWLNSASSLTYPVAFTGDQRLVELKGQGYFEIKQDARKPFIVKVNTMEVQVLGTHFDIMAYSDEKEVTTTLIQGAVKVKQGLAEKYLKPGQQAAMDHSTGLFTISDADVQQATAWKTGFFEFDNANITAIVRQLSRWYDIDIDNRAAGSIQLFGGHISRKLPLSEILHMLEANGARFHMEGKKLVVDATR